MDAPLNFKESFWRPLLALLDDFEPWARALFVLALLLAVAIGFAQGWSEAGLIALLAVCARAYWLALRWRVSRFCRSSGSSSIAGSDLESS